MNLPSWDEINKNINTNTTTLPSWKEIELSINKKEEELPSWGEIEGKISKPIEPSIPPKQLQDIAKIMPKPTEEEPDFKWEQATGMGAEYIPAKVYSLLAEKPLYAIGELAAKTLKAGFNAIGLKNVGDYFSESEETWKKPPVTEKVQEQTNIMRQNAYSKGMGQGVAFDVTEATTQLMGLLTQMAVTKQLPAFKGQGLSSSVKAMATHAVATTPGDIDERLQSAIYRVAYSITPFIANSTGATGITAVAVDTLLNTFLTSPTYIKALKEAENPEQFLSMAIPQLVMDIGMAWNTRGLPANQRIVMIDKYMKQAQGKYKLTSDEYVKAVEIASKMESKPAEVVREEVKFKSEIITPKEEVIPDLTKARNAWNKNQVYIDNKGNYRWNSKVAGMPEWAEEYGKFGLPEGAKAGQIVPFNKAIKKAFPTYKEFYEFTKPTTEQTSTAVPTKEQFYSEKYGIPLDKIKVTEVPKGEVKETVSEEDIRNLEELIGKKDLDLIKETEKLISPKGTIEGEKGSIYIPSMVEVQNIGTRLKSLVDIEAPFKKSKARETGFQLKNYYSNIGLSHEQALGEINKLNKAQGKIDYTELTFATENPTYMAKMTPEARKAVQPATKIITDYYNKWEVKLKEIGWMTEPFPQSLITRTNRKIGNLEASLDNIKGVEARAKVKAEINRLKDTIKRIRGQNIKFVSIPAKAILAKAENDPALNQKLMSIMPHWGRETVTVKDLVDANILTRQEADARFILGEYSDRIGRKYALGKIFENAEKEGLIKSQVEKPDWPTARIYVNGQSVSIPQMRGKRLDPFFSDVITNFFSKDQVTLKGLFGAIKMMQFYNPAIMPMYDVFQSASAGTFLNPVKGAGYIYKGIKDVIKKNDNYWSAYENGTFSKPYVIPYDKWEYQFKEAMKGNKLGVFLKKAALPLNWLPMVYNASWQTAWTLDPMVRMMTFNYLLDKGMTPREAGQTAALFHSDYASVPPATRKALNKMFFTPTFKITMGKLYSNMLYSTAKVGLKLPSEAGVKLGLWKEGINITKEDKILARGGFIAYGMMAGASAFFVSQGYKEVEKFRKYVKEVETDEGMKENVITLANPFNIPWRYYYRVKNAWNPSNLNVAQKLIDTFKWDLHPVWRVGYDIVENKNYSIYNPFDEKERVALDIAKYTTGEFVKITKTLLESADAGAIDIKNFQALQKDMGKLKATILKPFIFNYLREPERVRESWQIRSLEKEFRFIQYIKPSDDPKVNYERLQEFYKRLQEINNP